ncbi:MAG: hypothetical protein ACR2L1_07220 [Pyrinomonadaceae bacterium]
MQIIKTKILFVILILFCSQLAVFSQTLKKKDIFQPVILKRLAYHANYGSSNKFKLKSVVLAGFKNPQDDWNPRDKWIYVFHLKDAATGYELGKDLTPYTSSFLICTDETIGKILIDRKNEWLNQRVNIYLQPRDIGLTPFMNVGFVTKIELLDIKGKVIKTIQSEAKR